MERLVCPAVLNCRADFCSLTSGSRSNSYNNLRFAIDDERLTRRKARVQSGIEDPIVSVGAVAQLVER